MALLVPVLVSVPEMVDDLEDVAVSLTVELALDNADEVSVLVSVPETIHKEVGSGVDMQVGMGVGKVVGRGVGMKISVRAYFDHCVCVGGAVGAGCDTFIFSLPLVASGWCKVTKILVGHVPVTQPEKGMASGGISRCKCASGTGGV